MAYQARGRDPLLDSNMAEVIEKRGKELLGLVLLALGALVWAMFASYSPDDPSWLSAVDAPVQNWLGALGAKMSAAVFMIIGWGAWGIAALLGVWGVRFVLHRGQERATGRAVFAPIWLAVLSLYCAALPPGVDWGEAHSFGLGGLFGDTVLGALLGILPVSASVGLKLLALVLGLATVALGAFVLGFSRRELQRILRFLVVGVIMTYSWLAALAGRGADGAMRAARTGAERAAERRARRVEAAQSRIEMPPEPRVTVVAPRLSRGSGTQYEERVTPRAEPAPVRRPVATRPEAETASPPQKAGGLLARMPSLMRRADPEPEAEREEATMMAAPAPQGEDRIRAKIADVIKTRVRQSPAMQAESVAPLTKGRGRGPVPLVLDTSIPRVRNLPPEPPLTAAAAPLPPEPPLSASAASFAPGAAWMPQAADASMQTDVSYPDEDDVLIDEAAPAAWQSAPSPRIPVAEPRKVVQHAPRKAPQPSAKAAAEAQPSLQFEEKPQVEYELPPLNLLTSPETIQRHHLSDEALEENARMLESVLDDYGVKGEIVSVRPGPVVTMYELEPAPGLKASRVIGLADDIARSMAALSARVSTVPGRSVIGIELPNDNREMVVLREILATRDFGDGNQQLPLALGKDIGGDPIVANLAKMPHLLIAGTTGSGKSVAINTMILSLLYKLTPDECRLIMIDPKMLELSVYDGIPHLLSPVVTDPKKAVVALKWVVAEMEDRYRKMSKMGVRNISGYNGRVADAQAKGEMFSRTVQTGFDDETGEPVFETEEFAPEKMPYIVVIVDEMADLMMVAGKEIEACIQRLAQMARASGIHLIMATQRPSVDVITGTIKANFPTRISFQVTSKIDSRTILGEMGAEQLLGMGDMLYMAGGSKIIRCHGPFVSDEEVEEVVNNLKAYGPPDYVGGVVEGPDDEKAENIDAVLGLGGNTTGEDAQYDEAVQIVLTDRKCSTSYIQRKLGIGYNKAARLVEQMEDEGLVSPANHVGKREILVPEQ
ncbi:DNA translocase FtsK 4TM domain-containing protein [Roseovarius sp. SCSIO 43702]|uniref:DNA translocase FtsK n=1 Tax=Roseovarius sp. SCSIO 43702 TaxID=2823043 RepID=UPI001C72A42B|nr:DNA translocase FtsK 4TM domain-containing protein [Roseovarius sp. SCSIO 43702]QYX56483.1 DNA translocase FtsK 4TM domain-containing protein [Roseovarius sp. SCSIO 43702]